MLCSGAAPGEDGDLHQGDRQQGGGTGGCSSVHHRQPETIGWQTMKSIAKLALKRNVVQVPLSFQSWKKIVVFRVIISNLETNSFSLKLDQFKIYTAPVRSGFCFC